MLDIQSRRLAARAGRLDSRPVSEHGVTFLRGKDIALLGARAFGPHWIPAHAGRTPRQYGLRFPSLYRASKGPTINSDGVTSVIN